MTLRVMLFASWADALGARTIDLELPDRSTAGDVLAALAARANGAALAKPALAINRQLARSDDVVSAGDEIAVIPPVAGG